jgi:hypothetical protein
MKTTPFVALFLGAAIVLPATALAAGKPQQRENQTSAVGEIWLGYNFLDEELATTIDDDGYLGLGGDLRLNIPAGGATNFQLDLKSETGFVDNSDDNYTGSVMGGVHFSFREPNDWLFGGFAAVGNGFNVDEDTVTAYTLGGEAQLYLTDWTLYGQLGYLDAYDAGTGADRAFRDAWFLRGVGRFFMDQNVKLEGELSYATGENDTDASPNDMDVWGWGVRYERAISSMDTSLFLAYQGNYYDSVETGSNDQLTEHVIKLGLNVAFGIEGQKYIDRHGATLDLPMVTRWSAYGQDALD